MNPPIALNETQTPVMWRRQLVAADRETVRSLTSTTGFFTDAEVQIAVELVQEHLRQGEASGYHFLFAQQGPQVLGYACYGPIPCTTHSFDLYWVVVEASQQRRGLGRRLLTEVESCVRASGGRYLYVDTSGRAQYAPTRGVLPAVSLPPCRRAARFLCAPG